MLYALCPFPVTRNPQPKEDAGKLGGRKAGKLGLGFFALLLRFALCPMLYALCPFPATRNPQRATRKCNLLHAVKKPDTHRFSRPSFFISKINISFVFRWLFKPTP
jgi:hypothetical protein